MSVSVYVLGSVSPPELGSDIWTVAKQIHITTENEWQLLCKLVQLGAQQQEPSSSVNSLLTSLGIEP